MRRFGFGGGGRLRPKPETGAAIARPSAASPALGNLDLVEAEGDDFNVTNYELAVLKALASSASPSRVVEFGTYTGRTALNFATAAPLATITTIDMTDRATAGVRDHARIHRVYCDSRGFDEKSFLAEQGKAELIFVDGGHSYAVVRSDSEKALVLISDGGIVVWHDYTQFRGVQQAVDELAMEGRLPGLVQIQGTTMAFWRSTGPMEGTRD